MWHSMAWCVIRQRSYNRRYVALLAYHAAYNGAVYCLPFGVNLSHLVRVTVISRVNSTPRRLKMVTLAGQLQGWPVSLCAGISPLTSPLLSGYAAQAVAAVYNANTALRSQVDRCVLSFVGRISAQGGGYV